MQVTKYKITCKATGKFNLEAAPITCSRSAYDIARHFYKDDILIYESFYVMATDRAVNLLGYMLISQGGIAGTVVEPMFIAKFAIDTLAKNVVLVHNHPSGKLKPSKADIELTKKIVSCLKPFDVTVLDHIILSDKDFFSFADEGLL